MSLLAHVKGPGKKGFGYGTTAEEVTYKQELKGKRYLLTGCDSGIGWETLRVLGKQRAEVIGLARNQALARTTLDETGASGTPVARVWTIQAREPPLCQRARPAHGRLVPDRQCGPSGHHANQPGAPSEPRCSRRHENSPPVKVNRCRS